MRTVAALLLTALLLAGCVDDDGESINPRLPDPPPTAPTAPTAP
ncbi:MAG: hypothetical protein ACT4QF_21575 [Sporichthyaceae bacterium]